MRRPSDPAQVRASRGGSSRRGAVAADRRLRSAMAAYREAASAKVRASPIDLSRRSRPAPVEVEPASGGGRYQPPRRSRSPTCCLSPTPAAAGPGDDRSARGSVYRHARVDAPSAFAELASMRRRDLDDAARLRAPGSRPRTSPPARRAAPPARSAQRPSALANCRRRRLAASALRWIRATRTSATMSAAAPSAVSSGYPNRPRRRSRGGQAPARAALARRAPTDRPIASACARRGRHRHALLRHPRDGNRRASRQRDPRGLQPGAAARGLQLFEPTGRWSRRSARGRATGPRTATAELGALCGRAEPIALGRQANENPPVLRTHDRYGNRIDEVEFHPAWHELMRIGDRARAPRRCRGATRSPAPTSPARRCSCCCSQAEAGLGCPISMTYAAIPALRDAARARRGVGAALPLARLRRALDPGATEKRGALCGMAMTEKQGGSDVRANTTVADAAERRRRRRRVRDHRPQVVLLGADVRRVPRPRADRRRPLLLPPAALHARRRAQRASTSSASRTSSATAPTPRARSSSTAPGRGWSARRAAACRRSSRWSTTPGSTACSAPPPAMRAGVAQAIHHAAPPRRVRQAADRAAADAERARRPAIESEAATSRRCASPAPTTRRRRRRGRQRSSSASPPRCSSTGSASAAPTHAAEALECLGGNGYVEESGMPRLYREAPLNSIWEGSGNVQCLDVLRAMVTQPARARGLLRRGRRGRAAPSRGSTRYVAGAARRARATSRRSRRAPAGSSSGWRSRCRARCWSATATPAVADAFCASRLGGDWGQAFGTLPAGADSGAIIERHAAGDWRGPGRPCAADVAPSWAMPSRQLHPARPPLRDPDRRRCAWFFVLFLIIFLLSGFYRDVLGGRQRLDRAYLLAVASALPSSPRSSCTSWATPSSRCRDGIGIAGITLWMFGGVARMSRDSDSPGDGVQDRHRRARS